MAEKTKDKKSIAKANGLKSTFKLGESTYFMTSFGKGNEALPEKYITGSDVEDIRKTFTAKVKENQKQTIINGVTKIPTEVQLPGVDNNLLQAKSTIEKLFFDKSFEDNIHIQIAYNIMDIKKLISVYANNIIYTVNNLLQIDTNKDFIGQFPTMNGFQTAQIAYEINKTKLITSDKGYRDYFYIDMSGVWNVEKDKSLSALNNIVKKKSDRNLKYFQNISNCIVNELGFRNFRDIQKTAESFEKIHKNLARCANYFSDVLADKDGNTNLNYTYECIRLLGTMRQTAFHSKEFSDPSKRNDYTLFEIDDEADANTRAVLDTITKNKIEAVNNSFVNTSTVNLNILFSIYPNTDKKKLIKEYYDFAVRKQHKNIGFSVKTIREILLTRDELKMLSKKDYDSVRQKLYSLFDFIIYTYYINNNEKIAEFVNSLRQLNTKNDNESTLEEKKHNLYENEADSLWESNNIKDIILKKLIPGIDKCKTSNGIKSLKKQIDKTLKSDILSTVSASSSLSYFSKAIYCICAFLDGKEINMFLDSIINSFDNIVSLIKSADYANINIKFSDSYSFFDDCNEYANELRFVKSVARMNKGKKAVKNSSVNIKGFQYYDAAATFGETDREKVKSLFKLSEKCSKEHKTDHTLRNFFINNVINSNRYNYVIRFINPTNVRKIMQNRVLVSFALGEIDDKQIIRYCESTQIFYDPKNPDYDKMRHLLSEKLINVCFDTFAKVSNSSKEAIEKERLKSLIGLYLTVVYLITKSLVKINTSYSIAFGIFERDCLIMKEKAKLEPSPDTRLIKNISINNNPIGLTEYFIKNNRVNSRIQKLVSLNKNHYNNETFKYFRNNVEHLAVVSRFPDYADDIQKIDSYFDLYHYLMLRILKEETFGNSSIKSDFTNSKIDEALSHQSAWKDFLYGILSPFAYNPARYINLACKNKFLAGYGK